ncbi:hypothetical protein KY318_03190 [Candidatus Woesearchaeota archaeon]|nr:hypothetical protein [Candidatus Woesearchaeota archaeon]
MKMTLDEFVEKLSTKIKTVVREQVLEYPGYQDRLKSNLKKAALGLGVGLVLVYVVPGNQPIVQEAAFGYAAVKGYQSLRDWVA